MLLFLQAISDPRDHEKVESIYHQYRDRMLRLAGARLRQMGVSNAELDAEDVVQNAFVKIVRHIDKLDFSLGEGAVLGYVMKIVANEAASFAADRTECDSLDAYQNTLTDRDFLEQLRVSERYDAVVEAIRRLDERYSITLSLRYVEEMSVKDIAALLGIAEKSVYTRIERGKKKLLQMLEGENL